MQNIYSSKKLNLNLSNTKGILHNVQIAKDMSTPRTNVTSKWDVSCVKCAGDHLTNQYHR
jgi:hypothetical protein